MNKKIEILQLQLAAHRMMLARLLVNVAGAAEDLRRLTQQAADSETVAIVRAEFPQVGDAYFREMELVLLMAAQTREFVDSEIRLSKGGPDLFRPGCASTVGPPQATRSCETISLLPSAKSHCLMTQS